MSEAPRHAPIPARPNARVLLYLASAAVLAIGLACGAPQAAPTTPVEPPADGPVARPEPVGPVWEVLGYEVRTGRLAAGDAEVDGYFVDAHALRLRAGSTVRIVLRSGDLDTVLRVETPDGLTLRNDDFWDGTNSMLQFEVTSPDVYRVEVSSYAPGSTGDYELAVREFEPEAAAATIALGDAHTGELAAGDPALGSSAELWFHASAGDRVRIRVTSADFDTTAYLLSPTGETWFNDDANDTGPDGSERDLDSTIEAIAPSTGRYQIVVSSYGRTGSGAFEVRTSARPPVVVSEGAAIPSTGYAGTNSNGRMFGVYAGITDYGPDDQLYGCADDATFLAEAFRHRRLQAPEDQVVLRDKAATRTNFIEAIRRIADKATEDDVVVVFYSGHGGVEPVDEAADSVELDGTDETLIFADGAMRDNEFARLMDTLRVDTLIIAIDACQSGGFARDVMTRPGRIGFFSSDEDVLSATAEPVRAGGYLSYVLRQAVLGHADARPRDGAMLAGELGDYVIEAGVRHHRDMNAEGSNEPLQRLLVERGSYGWNDLLWVFPRREDGSALDADLCLDSPPSEGASEGGSCR